MWPWEHLAFAYVLYSLFANVVLRRAPTSRETVAVVVASQLSDLVDKPFAWMFGITETGYSSVTRSSLPQSSVSQCTR